MDIIRWRKAMGNEVMPFKPEFAGEKAWRNARQEKARRPRGKRTGLSKFPLEPLLVRRPFVGIPYHFVGHRKITKSQFASLTARDTAFWQSLCSRCPFPCANS
jgi:hypothetical protein